MTKSEYIDWKNHPVTLEIFRQLQRRMNDLQEMLGESAGVDPRQDAVYVGAIKAYKDLVTIDFYDEEQEESL
jgi:hypothetical protein